jgi:hypothetical protein
MARVVTVVRASALSTWAGDLTRPAPLIAAATLAINDHALKGAGLLPAAVTGKLSDVAGLFLAGIVGVCLVRGAAAAGTGRRARRDGPLAIVTLVAIALAFSALKLWPAFNRALTATWGANALDASDLWCLPMLALAGVWLRDREAAAGPANPPRFATALALTGALLLCAATPAPPPVPPTPVAGWYAADAALPVACGVVQAWFSKSGKTGAGVTIAVTRTGDAPACVATITAARLRFADGSVDGRVVEQPAPVGRRAATTDPRDRSPYDALGYVGFTFDNEARWNRGDRTAVLELELIVAGEPRTWAVPAKHTMLTFPIGGDR